MEIAHREGVQKVPISPIGRVLGSLPSGLLVLTTRKGQQETGMLVSWVMQAGFAPPTVTVAIRHGRYVGDWVTQGASFVLNLLDQDHKHLLRYFAKGFPPQEQPFTTLDVERTARGVVVLQEALGYLECEPCSHIDSADHRIFLARVMEGRLLAARAPMVHVRQSGMSY